MAATVHRLPDSKPAPGYRVVAAKGSDEATIYVYGLIGSSWFEEAISADRFRKDLTALGDIKTLNLRINSEGGDVFDAQTMYSLLTQHKAKVVAHIDGLAASAASFLAMSANEIRISEGAFVMIHNAWTVAVGSAADLRKTADLLDTVSGSIAGIYTARTKQDRKAIDKMMADETWMTGPEAVAKGFADIMVENMKVAASVRDPSKFKNLPAALQPRRAAAVAALNEMKAASSR